VDSTQTPIADFDEEIRYMDIKLASNYTYFNIDSTIDVKIGAWEVYSDCYNYTIDPRTQVQDPNTAVSLLVYDIQGKGEFHTGCSIVSQKDSIIQISKGTLFSPQDYLLIQTKVDSPLIYNYAIGDSLKIRPGTRIIDSLLLNLDSLGKALTVPIADSLKLSWSREVKIDTLNAVVTTFRQNCDTEDQHCTESLWTDTLYSMFQDSLGTDSIHQVLRNFCEDGKMMCPITSEQTIIATDSSNFLFPNTDSSSYLYPSYYTQVLIERTDCSRDLSQSMNSNQVNQDNKHRLNSNTQFSLFWDYFYMEIGQEECLGSLQVDTLVIE
jgi:hypothetical protein